MKLRNKVKATREAVGISQHALSLRTGLSRVTLRSIERDDGYTPNGSVMLKLASELGVSMNDLFWSESNAEFVA